MINLAMLRLYKLYILYVLIFCFFLNDQTRNTAFKLLDKLEKEKYDKKILEEVLSIDAFALSKFNKWKERKNKSKGKGNKRKKKSNRSRIKKYHSKETSIALTIGGGAQ